MTRSLAAVIVVLLVLLGGGYLAFLNPEPVVLRVTPARTVSLPVAGALLAAFAGGASLVALAAGMRAGARGWRAWRTRRRARREAQRAALTARVEQLVWTGDTARARTELLRAEGELPGDAARLALLAETYLQDGDAASARRILEQGLERLGPEPRLLALLADAATEAGDLRAAAEALERACAALPASPRLTRRLRDVYVAAGRWGEALALQGHFLLGLHAPATLAAEEEILRGLRYENALVEPDPRRAARILLALARERPAFVPAWVSAGDCLVRAGRALSARRVWERGARRQPAVVLLERIERQNVSERRPERTGRFLRRLSRRHSGAPAVALFLARHLIQRGDLDQAAELLGGLSATLKEEPLAHALWGELSRRRGSHDVAANSFSQALGADLGLSTPFRCAACRQAAAAWQARCAGCGQWGTYRAAVEDLRAGAGGAVPA
jgi:tetratricopeptide (TPR) repeat protein